MNPKFGITARRVKGIANNLSKLKSKLEGKKVTVEYKTAKVFEGDLKVE